MILQNLDAVSEKVAKMGFLSPNFLLGHVTEFRAYIFYSRRTYVVWQSFEKIGAETEKEYGKKLSGKYNGRSLLRKG